jgi:hypothetical protein
VLIFQLTLEILFIDIRNSFLVHFSISYNHCHTNIRSHSYIELEIVTLLLFVVWLYYVTMCLSHFITLIVQKLKDSVCHVKETAYVCNNGFMIKKE